MKEYDYKIFPAYVLRTPLLPVSFFLEITSEGLLSTNEIKKFVQDPIINEAIYIASPKLHREMEKWGSNVNYDEKKEERMKRTILKYLSRMSSRCTPFGIFAGCSVGTFSKKTKIDIGTLQENYRLTRLDMNFLVALSQNLEKNLNIRNQILFYPNNSIYKVGDKFRYVDYFMAANGIKHQIAEIEYSEYVEAVLIKSSTGAKIKEMADELSNNEITLQEATDFIDELIDNRILISELEPSISGEDYLKQVCGIIEKIKGEEKVLISIQEIASRLKELDKKPSNGIVKYDELFESLKNLETPVNFDSLIRTDLFIRPIQNTLNESLLKNIKEAIAFLNRIIHPPHNSKNLNKFKEIFEEKYEGDLVKLSIALDKEIGIGYPDSQDNGDINPLIDNLPLINQIGKTHTNSQINPIDVILQKKIFNALKSDESKVILSDNDFEDMKTDWESVPDTTSAMLEIGEENGQAKIFIKGCGGSSAANILSRFSYGNTEIKSLIDEIIEKENQLNKNKVLAEIVHMPNSRVANILMHPDFREYEIPYLTKSNKPLENQIDIDDLYVKIKENRIVIYSKRLNKEVLPRLTNSHNFSVNSMPIYRFLCDLQTQGIRNNLSFNLNPIFYSLHTFIPRIEYREMILSKAMWNLSHKDVGYLTSEKSINLKDVDDFRSKYKIPVLVLLAEGDNNLLINFKNLNSTKMFFEEIKNKKSFRLIEFLFDKSSIMKRKNDYYANEVIVSLYKTTKKIDTL